MLFKSSNDAYEEYKKERKEDKERRRRLLARKKLESSTMWLSKMSDKEIESANIVDLGEAEGSLSSASGVSITDQSVRIRDATISSVYYQRVLVRQNDEIIRQNKEIISTLKRIADGLDK